jgi:tyrosine-specific transport protein
MKKKTLSAIFLLVGTAVGSGLITLPMVLSQIGILKACGLMLLCTFVAYVSALARCELNLQSKCDFTLEDVGLHFSGKMAALLGNVCLKILSFSLLSAYIYGLSSVFVPESAMLKIIIAGILFVLFASSDVLSINKYSCFILMGMVIFTAATAYTKIKFTSLSLTTGAVICSNVYVVLPILFTSFGFHGSLHSLTKFCNNDSKMIQKACLWGSSIAASIYFTWYVSITLLLRSVHENSLNPLHVHEWLALLKSLIPGYLIEGLVVFTISTSMIGVGIALMDDLHRLADRCHLKCRPMARRILLSGLTVLPAIIVALWIPEAFINVLSFSGCILAILAIMLPLFLLSKISGRLHFSVLNSGTWRICLWLFSIGIVVCECLHLLSPL